MVCIISSGSESTTMDGSVDISTPVAFSMWKFVLDTSLRTIRNDQLCLYPCHKKIWGKAIYLGHSRVSFIGTYVRLTRTSSVAQPDDASLERPT